VVILGFVLGSSHLAAVVMKAAAPVLEHGAAKAHAHAVDELAMPYAAAAGAPALAGIIVAVFYCLAALNGERRDRSLLFWKSLPVSDLTAVAAKAFVPLIAVPLATLAVVFTAHVVLLLYSTVVLAVNGVDPGLLWTHLPLPMIWVMLPYGLALNALWYAPLYGWLLLVSAFAKRLTFVWALAVPLGLALFEFVTLHTHRVWSFLDDRINEGYAQAFSVGGLGKAPISSLSQVDPGRFFALPGLWGGLVVFALSFAACVWLRRRHDPV
jgi:ABC-2 type transport system permease protein